MRIHNVLALVRNQRLLLESWFIRKPSTFNREMGSLPPVCFNFCLCFVFFLVFIGYFYRFIHFYLCFRIFVCFYIVFHHCFFSRQWFSLQLYSFWFHPLCPVFFIVLPTVASWLHWHFLNFLSAFKVTAYLCFVHHHWWGLQIAVETSAVNIIVL